LPPPEAIYWMLRSCFIELMDKEAMRSLEIPKWRNANNAYKLQHKNGLINGNHVNGDTKKTKTERSTDLGIGLARLAHRCYVSPVSPLGAFADDSGIQTVRTCVETNANDGSYPFYRSSEKVDHRFKHRSQAREMVGRDGEVRRGRTAG